MKKGREDSTRNSIPWPAGSRVLKDSLESSGHHKLCVESILLTLLTGFQKFGLSGRWCLNSCTTIYVIQVERSDLEDPPSYFAHLAPCIHLSSRNQSALSPSGLGWCALVFYTWHANLNVPNCSNIDHHMMQGLTRWTPLYNLTRQQKKSTIPWIF